MARNGNVVVKETTRFRKGCGPGSPGSEAEAYMRSSQSIGILILILLALVLAWSTSALAQPPATTPNPAAVATSPTNTAPATSPTNAATAKTNQPGRIPASLSKTTRLLFLGGAALITFLLGFFLSGLHPLGLIVGEDNRYSNSKFQVALWFFVLITTYIATFALRAEEGLIGQIGIPEHLLLLSGMSAFTYAAAKGITTSKVNDAQSRGIADPKNTAASPSLLKNLTHDDGMTSDAVAVVPAGIVPGAAPVALLNPGRPPSLDLGDTQMIIVTLLAVAAYLYATLHFMGNSALLNAPTTKLPDVDSTILSIFGIGQGAYITKKAVGNVGQA